MEFKRQSESVIKTAAANPGTDTKFREPLIGFASTDGPIFNEKKEIIDPHILHPKEIFP